MGLLGEGLRKIVAGAIGDEAEGTLERVLTGQAAQAAPEAAEDAVARRVVRSTPDVVAASSAPRRVTATSPDAIAAAQAKAYQVRRAKATAAAAAQRGAVPKPKPPTDLSVFPAGASLVRPADVAMDPRLETRAGELGKVSNLDVVLSKPRIDAPSPLSIFDMEGKPFITSMSDMSAAGDSVLGLNGVPFGSPVHRLGGQDFMFDDPNHVWASEKKPSQDILDMAQTLKTKTGQNPLYLPWTMGPTAIDFAHMPRSTMLQYSAANMGKRGRNELTKDIRTILPDFADPDDPASIAAFEGAVGGDRSKLNTLLDMYRDRGGLGQGAARLATTDLSQLGTPLTTLRNVGMVDPSGSIELSQHPSYRFGIPGEGLGRLQENVGALQLLPDLMAEKGMTDPFAIPVGVQKGVPSPLRSMQMSPYGGVIDDKMLRLIQDYGAQ